MRKLLSLLLLFCLLIPGRSTAENHEPMLLVQFRFRKAKRYRLFVQTQMVVSICSQLTRSTIMVGGKTLYCKVNALEIEMS